MIEAANLKKFLCLQVSYRGGSYCLSLQARDSQLLLFGDLLIALEQLGILASVSSSVQEKCWCHHCIWQRTISDHLQVTEQHIEKNQPLLPSSCFGAGEFAIQARGNASLGTVMRINVCEEQLNIIVHFACQDSANIFSFLCWIWIYVASDTLDKHYIHHLSCSLASEKGTICL